MPHLLSRLTGARGRLHMPTVALADMTAEGWRTWPNETGGILLGASHGTVVQVAEVIGPGPKAVHMRYNFTPDSDWQAEQVAAAWSRNPSIEYLGDWHTHPGGSTQMSRLDTETAELISKAPRARQPAPVMVVLALCADATSRAAATRYQQDRLLPLALHVSPMPR